MGVGSYPRARRWAGGGLVILALLVALAACTGPSSAAPTPGASSSPSAAASAPASASAGQAPSGGPLAMSIKSITKTVAVGKTAGITVDTKAGATCKITVTYDTGPSKAAGLEPTVAATNGYAQWGWQVEPGTTPGTWPIDVTCELAGLTGSLHTEFTVK